MIKVKKQKMNLIKLGLGRRHSFSQMSRKKKIYR